MKLVRSILTLVLHLPCNLFPNNTLNGPNLFWLKLYESFQYKTRALSFLFFTQIMNCAPTGINAMAPRFKSIIST